MRLASASTARAGRRADVEQLELELDRDLVVFDDAAERLDAELDRRPQPRGDDAWSAAEFASQRRGIRSADRAGSGAEPGAGSGSGGGEQVVLRPARERLARATAPEQKGVRPRERQGGEEPGQEREAAVRRQVGAAGREEAKERRSRAAGRAQALFGPERPSPKPSTLPRCRSGIGRRVPALDRALSFVAASAQLARGSAAFEGSASVGYGAWTAALLLTAQAWRVGAGCGCSAWLGHSARQD